MAEQIYVYLNGEQRGPFTRQELCDLHITPDTPVWYSGLEEWAPAGSLPLTRDLCMNPGGCPPNPQAPFQQPGQYQQPQYQQGQYQQPPYQQTYGQQPPYTPNPGPGYAPGQPMNQMPPCPDTYLVWAILTTLCCCLPFGIVAIVYSSKVNSAYNAGDYNGAVRNSNIARNWCIASAISGVVFSGIYYVMMLAGAFTGLL